MTASSTTTTTATFVTTQNDTMKQLWKSEVVMVRYLPDTKDKPNDYDLHDVMMDIEEKRNLQELKLTPPIVVAWVYYLARALTEGIKLNDNRSQIE